MNNASIGTHHVRKPASRQNLRHASVYGERRESGGMVRYAGNRMQRNARSKRVILAVIGVVVVVIVAILAGKAAFHASVTGKMAISDDVKAALSSEPNEGPYYALFVADLKSSDGNDGADALLLARIDEENVAVSLLNIPYNMQVRLSDAAYHPLCDACSLGGDAELIDIVADVTGLDICHFMRTDRAGFVALVDAFGGVQVKLTEPLDDPTAGSTYLSAGTYTLTGEQAVTYMLAVNFTDGVAARAQHQNSFAATLAQTVFAQDGTGFSFTLDKLASNIKTDWDSKALISLEDALSGLQAASILQGITPGYETSKGEKVFITTSDEFSQILALFEAGSEPVIADTTSTSAVDPSSFTIIVKNGAGVAGEASVIQGLLTAQGFVVTEATNADSYVYDETLIVYKDDSMLAAANAVQQALGFGRVISAGSFYEFDQDILVMYGGDRKIS